MAKSKLSQLTPDKKNANKGTERGRYMVEKSLQELGAGRSILVDKHGNIIAGNKTAEAAASIGLDNTVIVETDGSQLVVVKRTDLDLDDPTGKARQLAYADNRTSEVSYELDPFVMASDIEAGLDLSNFYFDYELEGIFEQAGSELIAENEEPQEPQDSEPQIDKAKELAEKWGVQPGQLWILPSRDGKGEHRLLCGDSTKEGDVIAVMNGDLCGMMVTDPPYGVEYDATWRKEAGIKNCDNNSVGKVVNDDRADWGDVWDLFSGDVAYIWHAMKTQHTVATSLLKSGFEIRAEIIWVKEQGVISRGHYNPQHESCFYCVRKNKTSGWVGDNTQTTVWRINKPNRKDTGHSTQKPLECMSRAIVNHKAEMIFDPFLGSGTTLIACENTGRYCRAIEISPGYVAVALQRYLDTFGIEATCQTNQS